MIKLYAINYNVHPHKGFYLNINQMWDDKYYYHYLRIMGMVVCFTTEVK